MTAWITSTLGEIGDALIGLTYSPAQVTESGGTLVLRSSNIQGGRLALDDTVYVNASIPDKIRVRASDILICVRNGSRPLIGKSLYLDERVQGETFGAFMAVFRSPLNDYLRYFFQSDEFKRQVDEHLGATINQITNRSLKGFTVVYPSAPDRKEIARLLADVDGLIEAMTGLISKKRAIKQGLMQRLLTGRTRLVSSDQNDNDSFARLSDLLQRSATYGIVKAGEFQSAGVPMLRGGDIKGGRIGRGLPYVTKRKSEEFSRTVLKSGDVVVALVGYPGDSAVVPDWLVGANISRAVGLLRPGPKLLPEYLAQYLNSPVGRAEFLKPSAGSAQIVVNLADLNKLQIPLVSLNEQRAIASALADADDELDALERRLEATRSIKQGMMQELMTGRTRLVPAEASA